MIRHQDGKILESQIESTDDFDYRNLLVMKYLEVNWGLLGTSSSLQELNRINNNSLKQEKNLMRKAGKKLKDGGFDKSNVNRAVKVANDFKDKRARTMMRMTPEFHVKVTSVNFCNFSLGVHSTPSLMNIPIIKPY